MEGTVVIVEGSVAVITGGASGLGEACVRNLIMNGAKVGVFDVQRAEGEKLLYELGNAVRYYQTDVTDEKAVELSIERVFDDFGAIHITVNCAGIGIPAKVLGKNGPMPISQFSRVVEVNLFGTMNVIKASAAKMVRNRPNDDGERGLIVNTASAAAFEGQIGQAAYSASKAAIVGMTLPIAREFAEHGIRVLTIAPGLFDTPILKGVPEKARENLYKLTPFPSRFGKPSEYAQLVWQIIENPMLNGTTIRLDAALRMPAR
jgi:3-hydroxyacyl-CoA dehydrogenase / 3-hydroxy-2-methylbutyryl-CoA dehydrogenase